MTGASRVAARFLAASAIFLAERLPAQEAVPPPAAPLVLPFVEDDYPKALAAARARRLPLFVEAWAPWCHTCRSMRAYVFTDPALRPRAGQFVWLSIDTEKKGNAPFLVKFPVEAWPTTFVVDPATETALLRFVGGASVKQVLSLLDDGLRAARGRDRGADALLARADRMASQKKHAEAAPLYREAIASAPAGWKSYARAVDSLLFVQRRLDQKEACAVLAREAFGRLAATSSSASVVGTGLDCALGLPRADPARAGLVSALAADARKVLAGPPADAPADDVSSLYEVLADEREEAGDAEGRRRVLEDWAAYLEAQASRAKTPDARAVFDAHRLGVYLALGQPRRAVPMLEQSQENLPDDYNPSARLAVALEAMGDYENALIASDQALSLAYGPRLIGILTVRSRIHQEKGDLISARIALEEAVREAEALPEGQRSERQIASLKEKIAQLPR